MKVELTVMDRLVLLQLIPREDALFLIRMWDNLRQAIHFEAGEIDALEIEQKGERVEWNQEAETTIGPKEVDIHVRLLARLHDRLEQLDKEEKINVQLANLCEKLGYTGTEE